MAFIFNPDKYIRAAYINQLSGFAAIYADAIPKSSAIGDKYILITSITKTRTQAAKPTSELGDNWTYLVNIVFDINVISPAGYANPTSVEDIEENIVNVAETILIGGWAIKSRVLIQSIPLPVKTPTSYVNRRILTYQHLISALTNPTT